MSRGSRFTKFIIISSVIHILTCIIFSISASPQKVQERSHPKIKMAKKNERQKKISNEQPEKQMEREEPKNTEPQPAEKQVDAKSHISQTVTPQVASTKQEIKVETPVEKPLVQKEQELKKIISDTPNKFSFASDEKKSDAIEDKPSIKIENTQTYDLHGEEYDEETKKWLRGIRLKISTIASYPDSARQKKIEGNVDLCVTLDKDGQLKSIEFNKKSGYKILDEAAINKIKHSSPFPPFPKKTGASFISFNITIVYKTR